MDRGISGWIWLLTVLGAVLRVLVAVSRADMVWPDEHFQVLEPAAKVVFGYGMLSWEWLSGYRPWIVPGLYLPLFGSLKLLGIDGGLAVVLASRAFTAIVSASVILSLDRVMRFCGASLAPRVAGVACFALSAPMILWSCTTLADHWAMIAAWSVIPLILERLDRADARAWFLMGVLAGFPILLKAQMIFWTAGAALALILLRTPAPRIAWVTIGVVLDLALLAALDGLTWGKPLQSPLRQLSEGRGISDQQGVSPGWAYFPMLVEDQGLIFLSVLVGALGCAALRPRRAVISSQALSSRARLGVLFLPFAVLLLSLSAIGHKETRFILPLLPALYLLVALALDRIGMGRCRVQVWRGGAVTVLLATSAFSAQIALERPVFLSSNDTAALEEWIRRDGALPRDGSGCVLLVAHEWEWTRGLLVMGGPAKLVGVSPFDLPESRVDHCPYAIVAGFDSDFFTEFAGPGWSRFKVARTGHVLFKRIRDL